MKLYPKGSKVWSEQLPICPTPSDIQKRYEEGFSGVYVEPDETSKFNQIAIETGGFSQAEEAAQHFGWFNSFEKQLVASFIHVMELMPGSWPGPAQQRGDCVSHSNKNAIQGSLVGEVVAGQPDEVTGYIERIPEISSLGLTQGALSTEVSYFFRNHGGDGWQCHQAASVAIKKAGAFVRKNYPEIGIDFTRYSGKLAGRWGRTPPPEDIAKHFRNNLIRTASNVSTFEGIRDNLAQGRFISSCGSEGFSNVRDAYSVSSRRGTWHHAMAYIGTDDRPEIVNRYKSPLVLVLNSWNVWNSGPRDIFDSAKYVPAHKKDLWIALDIVNPVTGNIMVPKGSFFAKWTDIQRRSAIVYAGVNGWKMQKIKSFGLELIG